MITYEEIKRFNTKEDMEFLLVSKGFNLSGEITEIPYVDCVVYEQRIL